MKIITLLALSIMLLSWTPGYGQSAPEEKDPLLIKMFNYANTHDLIKLEELSNEVRSKKDHMLTAAYFLALYIAAPQKYKEQYVDHFPVDDEGMRYFNEKIELIGLTPSYLYSIDAIGLIAAEGNEKAMKKVIIGINHSDGGAAELFCDSLEKMFDKQAGKTIKVLSQSEKSLREKAYSCFEMMEAKEFDALKNRLKKVTPHASKSEIRIIREIENYQ